MAEILAGDSYGRMHACSISTRSVIKAYGSVSQNSHINNLSISPKDSQVFIFGHTSKSLCFYNLQEQKDSNIEIESEAKIIGSDLANGGAFYSYEDSSIAFIDSEQIEGVIEKESIIFQRESMPKTTSRYKKGKVIDTDNVYYTFVGFDVTPSIVDLIKQNMFWTGKNVSNDYLDLHVPIRDVDVLGNKACNQLFVLHEDRKIRIYDIRKQQKKPSFNMQFNFDKYKFKNFTSSPCQNYLYIGGAQGSVFKVDRRKNYQLVKKLSGPKGAVTSLSLSPDGSHIVAGSLDGYLRIYNEQDSSLVESLYLAQPIHSVLFIEPIDLDTLQQTKLNPILKQKVPKRRNTVKLDYLTPRKFVKLEEQEENQKQEYVKKEEEYENE